MHVQWVFFLRICGFLLAQHLLLEMTRCWPWGCPCPLSTCFSGGTPSVQVSLVQTDPSSDHCYDTITTLMSLMILNWWPLEASPLNKFANSTFEARFLIERILCHPVVDIGKYTEACKYKEAMSLKIIFWLSLCCQSFFAKLNRSQICPSVHIIWPKIKTWTPLDFITISHN